MKGKVLDGRNLKVKISGLPLLTKLRNLHIMTHIAALKHAVYNGKAMKGTSREMTCSAQKAAGR